MIQNTQLLCTFSTNATLEQTLAQIHNSYDVMFDTIYVLEDTDLPDSLCCTYNINVDSGLPYNIPEGTISLHRKKHTNTLYTINALNMLVKQLNNGVIDRSFRVNWEAYSHTILVTAYGKLKVIKTKLKFIRKLGSTS